MAITIATGIVNIRPDIDEGQIVRAGQNAGQNTGNAFVRGLDGRLRDSEGNLVNRATLLGNTMSARLAARFLSPDRFDTLARSLGINIVHQLDDGIRAGSATLTRTGDDVGNRITRGIDGRMRDSRGRFIRATDDMSGSLGNVGGSVGRVAGQIAGMGTSAAGASGPLAAVGGAIAAIAAASALPAISALGPIMIGFIGISKVASFAFDGVGEALKHAGEDAEKYKEALKGMSPEQRAFTEQLAGMKKGLEGFKKEIQKIVLPAFTQALKDAKPAIGVVKEGMRGAAEVFRDFGKEFGKLFASNRFQNALRTNFELGNQFTRQIMMSLDDFTLSWLEFGAKSKPVIDTFGTGMSGLLTKGLPGFFEGLSTGVEGSAKMFDGLFAMINKILPAFGKLSGQLADTFGPVLGQIFVRAGDLVHAIVEIITPPLKELAPLFDSIAELMGQTAGATDGLASAIGKGLGAVVKIAIIPLKNIVDIFIIAAPIFKNLATTIIESVAPAFGKINGSLGWADKLQNWAKNNKLVFQQIFSMMTDAIMGFIITVVEHFPAVFSIFRNLAIVSLEVFGALLTGAAKAFGWVPGLGDKLKSASGSFNKFKDSAIDSLNKAQQKAEDFSAKVTPRLEENRLKMNIKNWELQLETAKADLKKVPPEKRSALLATIKDLQQKVKDGKSALASVKDKNANIKGTNKTGAAVSGAKSALGSVKDRNAQIKAANKTGGAVDAAKRALASVVSRTVNIIANFSLGGAVSAARKIFGFAGGGRVNIPGFANGGRVNMFPFGGLLRGPGSGTSDSMIARVSNGEFIIRKRAVDFFGADLFEGLNNMTLSPAQFASDMSNPARTAAGAGQMMAAPTVHKTIYQFAPGSIVLDASQIRSIQDVVRMIETLKVTSRQFGARL